MTTIPIRRVLVSVSDKSRLTELLRPLAEAGVEILSTGGTRRALEEAGLPVRDVAAYTGFPEMMDGRVKTLHPRIHGGILARRDHDDDLAKAREHGIELIDLVVVNLYPFAATVAKPGVSWDEAIEQIDIGGPSLVRAAAKNHAFVAVATDPAQYAELVKGFRASGGTSLEMRRQLAGAAFAHTAAYDRGIADYFAGSVSKPAERFPERLQLDLQRVETLRYGENPHQQAALYSDLDPRPNALARAKLLSGKELSYNNLLDLDSAWAIARGLSRMACVVVKHNNPCGAAIGASQAETTRAALDGDATSAFGGIVAFNQPVTAAAAEVLVEPSRFLEAVVAPGFESGAVEVLTTKPKWKASVRLVDLGGSSTQPSDRFEARRIDGGYLVQEADAAPDPETEWRVASRVQPTDKQWADLRLAWAVCRQVKSNAIVVANGGAIAGVGAGQMSRIDSVEISLRKAGDRARGAALASDAFFPFDDSIHAAAAAGIATIIQPGGSRNDESVLAACEQHGIALVLTGRRHFKH